MNIALFLFISLLFSNFCSSEASPWTAEVEKNVVPQYNNGIREYQGILDHLINDEVIRSLVDDDNGTGVIPDLENWADQLRLRILSMHNSLDRSASAAQNINQRMNSELESMAVRSSKLDNEINGASQQVATLEAQVNGLQNQVNQAQNHLNQAEASLQSHENAVREAERKYNRKKNDCFGRKKRSVETIIVRKKRGWFRKVTRAISKPFRSAGRALRRGACRVVGTLTGSIKRAKKARNNARAARDNARNTLHQRQGQLQERRHQLAQGKANLVAKQKVKQNLEVEKQALLSKIRKVGAVSKDLKDAVNFVDQLVTRSRELKQTVEDLLLDVEVLLVPLQEAGGLLRSQFQIGAVSLLTPPTPEQLRLIQKHLEIFATLLPHYPLIISQ